MLPAARHLLAALHTPEGRDDGLLAGLSPAQWSDVANLAIRQRVGPLLYSRAGLPLPEEVRAQLRKRAEASAFKVLTQVAAFRELADRAATLGIPLIALKGLHLASTVYASPGLREMADIDVLVAPEELDRVMEAARALGYAPPQLGGASHHHLPPMVRGRVSIEVHWRLADEGPLSGDLSALRRRTVRFPHGGMARCLAPEDLLLHVCAHAGAHHVLEIGLRPLCDVQALLTRSGATLNWSAVAARARALECHRSLGLILTMCRVHLGVRAPELDQLGLADSRPPQALVDAATDFMLSEAHHLSGTSEAARHLLTLPTTSARVRHIARQVIRPQETLLRVPGQQVTRGIGALVPLATRVVGLSARHAGWLWRASRDRNSPIRTATERRNRLAAWIRGQ